MSDDLIHDQQTAVAEWRAGPMSARAEVRVTPAGVVAIGLMLSGVLLSTAVLVWASTSVARRRVHHHP
jgi:hypothetical protein